MSRIEELFEAIKRGPSMSQEADITISKHGDFPSVFCNSAAFMVYPGLIRIFFFDQYIGREVGVRASVVMIPSDAKALAERILEHLAEKPASEDKKSDK
jgi:hypothetical protein